MRVFNAKNFLSHIWTIQTERITSLRLKLAEGKEQSQSVTLTANTLMSVILYSIGSYFVVEGQLTIGALIGANILASRSYMNIVKLVQTGYLISQAQSANENLNRFSSLPVESDTGTAIKSYNGKIAFRDLGFGYPGSTGPLFESIHLDLEPGNILMVTGKNGAGKTTLARLITGLLNPARGEILAGGINLNQIALPWWRQQIMYFPQEPTFINASIKENITLIKPDIDNTQLNRIINMSDLRTFLDRTPNGMDTILSEGGKNLALGIRRRLALARSLVTNGNILVFDEPLEGLDQSGINAIKNILEYMSGQGKTIITFSHAPYIFRGKGYIMNLDKKPVPEITMIKENMMPEGPPNRKIK